MNNQQEYLSQRKIYTFKVKAHRGYNPYEHMNPYQFLENLNLVVRSLGWDMQIVEVKYLQIASKAQKIFDQTETTRYDFMIEHDKNKVFETKDPFLDWIFQIAQELKKPENSEASTFDKFHQQEKKKEQTKKLQEINNVLSFIMKISEDDGKGLSNDDLISFNKFKKLDINPFRQGQYNVFIKAKLSLPLKVKLDQQKEANKPVIVPYKNHEIKCHLHPTSAPEESGEKVQELALISDFTLGCAQPPEERAVKKEDGLKYYHYFSHQRMKTKVENINKTIKLQTFLAIHKDLDSIKSFELQTYFFNQTIVKTHVNMGQIRKIDVYQNRDQNIYEYYFYLAYPPKYFISQLKRELATIENYMVNWERIENIFFLRNPKIFKNQFLRLYLFNNTILHIMIKKEGDTNSRHFQRAKDMLDLIISKFDDKITVPINYLQKRIAFGWRLKALQTSFDYTKGFENKLSQIPQKNKVWILKYFILIMIRYNHLFPYQITQIMKQIQQNSHDLDVYLYVFWKFATTDAFGYNNQGVRFSQYLFEEFQSAKSLNRTHLMKKIIKNTDLISHVFRLNVTPSGFLYAAPSPQMKGRLMKQYDKQSEYFLRASVCDDHQGTLKNQKYITKSALKNSMLEFTILGRKYIPLGWSPSQLRGYSLWYMHQTNNTASERRLNRQIVLNFLGNFEAIENPAKRAARIGQSFSASWTYQAHKIKEQVEDDIYSEGKFNFTDGIGKISGDLIDKISLRLGLSQLSILQIRYKGGKGILVLDDSLDKNTIVLRPSMIKYKCQKQSAQKYLDILDYNKYKAGFLNRQVIILLKTLKIKDAVFEELQKTHLTRISQMSFKDCSAFKHLNQDLNNQINNLQPANKTILSLVRAGFELQYQPFFRGVLETMKKNGYHQLKQKCNIRVEKSARIIGIIDEFGVLEENQVYCALYDPFSLKKQSEKLEIVEGKAVITRNPCLDPADIRLVTCLGEAEITARFEKINSENKFAKFVNCVIFPKKGQIPLTAQISGSDLDGDNFFICWDDNLIPKDEQEIRKIKTIDNPNTGIQKKQGAVSKKTEEQSYREMMDFFFEYINYQKLGQIDNSHLVKADQDINNYADNPDCMKLCEIHGKAVDFPKTGYCPEVDPKLLVSQYPDFMEKTGYETYPSMSILGKLYRQIKDKIQDLLEDKVYKGQQSIDDDLVRYYQIQTYTELQVTEAYSILRDYEKTLSNLIGLVGIDTEYEIYSGNFSIVKQKVDQYGKNRLIATILNLRERYFDLFFDNLQQDQSNYKQFGDENFEDKLAFSQNAKRKAILYYLVSYTYKFNDKLKYPTLNNQKFERIRTWVNKCMDKQSKLDRHGKFCGYIWFVIPKVIINIKKLALKRYQKEQKNKKIEKKIQKQEQIDDDKDSESSSKSEDDDEII